MKVLCKILGLGDRYPASDGSIIPKQVMEEYLNSEAYRKSIEEKTMISSLTHRCRNLSAVFPDKPALKSTIGKNDALLIVGGGPGGNDAPCPTHVVTKLFIGEDDWLYGEMEIFDPELFDDYAKDNIKRLLGLLRSGCKVHTSAVIIGYWLGLKNGVDLLKKLVSFSGVDCTLSSSWKDSHIVEILEDENYEKEARNFSNVESIVDYEGKEGIVRAKCFSDLTGINVNVPKSSKIDGRFTMLKAKSFSSINPITIENNEILQEVPAEKTFSPAQVNERIRLSKMSPRLRMRRLVLDYRQALKQQGGADRISPESLKIMKSLFAQDLLGILQELTPQVVNSGKNLNALLGASSLGVEVRKATQKLQIPFRLALMESKKSGFVSKTRYQKILEAYNEFVKAVLDYVFETPTNQKLKEEEEEENGEN